MLRFHNITLSNLLAEMFQLLQYQFLSYKRNSATNLACCCSRRFGIKTLCRFGCSGAFYKPSLLSSAHAAVMLHFTSFSARCSRTSTNNYGSEAGHSPYSGGRQHEDEFLSNHQNPMMMTIKKPMQASSRRPASPPAR